jgi:hypothetical protein
MLGEDGSEPVARFDDPFEEDDVARTKDHTAVDHFFSQVRRYGFSPHRLSGDF